MDPVTLRPSGALLATHIALSSAIQRDAVSVTDSDATTLDLLVRLDLAPDKRLRAVELSRQLCLSASHVSRRLDRAESEGLIRRESDPDDRRAQQVVLTKKGRALNADFAPALEAVVKRAIFEALNESEIDSLVDMLERIEAAALEAP